MPLHRVYFTKAPAHLQFVLNKTPSFDNLTKANDLLRHYKEEFGCEGYVCTEYGIGAIPA